MAGSLGSLYVSLEAKFGAFFDGLTKAQTVSKSQMRQIQRNADQFASEFSDAFKEAALSATVAFAGVSDAVKDTLDQMEQQLDAARQMNVPLQQYSALAAAAKVYDVSNQSLTVGMQQLIRQQTQFASGSKLSIAAFKALGVDPTKFNSTIGLFNAVVGALRNVQNPAEKLQLELQLLGRSGTELNPIINASSQEFQELQKQAVAVGAALSTNAAGAYLQADDAFKKLQLGVTGLKTSIVVALLPYLTELAERFEAWIVVANQNGTIAKIADAIKTLGNIVIGLVNNWQELVVVFAALKFLPIIQSVVSLTTALGGLSIGGLVGLINPVTLVVAALAGLTIGFMELRKAAVAAPNAQEVATVSSSIQSGIQTTTGLVDKLASSYGNAAIQVMKLMQVQMGQANFQSWQANSAVADAGKSLAADQERLKSAQALSDLGTPGGTFAAGADLGGASALADSQVSILKEKVKNETQTYNQALADQKKANDQIKTLQDGIAQAQKQSTMKGPATGNSFNSALAATSPAAMKAASALQKLNQQVDNLVVGNSTLAEKEANLKIKLADQGAAAIKAGADQTKVQAEVAKGMEAITAAYQRQIDVQNLQEQQYVQGMQQQLNAQQKSFDLSLQSVNMTQDQIDAQSKLNNVVDQYNQKLQDINNQIAIAKANGDTDKVNTLQKQYTDTGNVFAAALNQQVSQNNQLQAQKESPLAGMKEGMTQFAQTGLDVADQMKSAFDNLFSGLSDAIAQWVVTGKASFKDILQSFIEMIVKMEIEALAAKVIMSFLGIGGVATPSGISGVNGTATSVAGGISGLNVPYGQAKGGAWFNGVQKFARGSAFANRIVSSPTLFKFAGGTGMMGEAGPEAIMPLTRGKDGKLGVQVSGNSQASGNNTAPVTVNVINNSGSQAQVQESTGQDGSKLINVIIGEVNNQIARGGSTYKTISQTFGLRRQGVPV